MSGDPGRLVPRLEAGETVLFSPTGTSMQPRIRSGQELTIAPVDVSKLRKGDIVFARVWGAYLFHKVSGFRNRQVQIARQDGRTNGWTGWDNVYGIVIEIDGKPVRKAKKKVRE